jgi:ferredoxin-NADP reductase/DMSO/TMAO reductase YedYZ heme-binding membrane subunit
VNANYFRVLVILNGLLTLLLVAWDAVGGRLGANPVNTAIHITGILSLVFLILSLVITPLRLLAGWTWLIAGRRALGLLGFAYAAIHLLIYFWWDRMGDVSSTLSEIAERRFLTIGFIALCLMIPLAVTSTDGMIRRLGPSKWKLLHRISYVVVVLGVVHFYMLVKSDVRQPLFFAAVLTPLFGARVGYAWLQRMRATEKKFTSKGNVRGAKSLYHGELVVQEITQETANVKTFRFHHPEKSEVPFLHKPGQYMTLQLEIDGQRVRRSYTIASSPMERRYVELTIKRHDLGLVSRYMHDRVMPGSKIRVIAPAGKFWFDGGGAGEVVLIAGGVGITPPMTMLRYLIDIQWKGTIYFLNAVRSSHDVIFADELESLARDHSQVKIHYFYSERESAASQAGGGILNSAVKRHFGRIDADTIKGIVPRITELPVYLCGPEPMMQAVRDGLMRLGVSAENIHTEEFSSPAVSATTEKVGSDTSPSEFEAIDEVEALFSKSNVTLFTEAEKTVLEIAEENDVAISWECRAGICGQCKVRCLSGKVKMESRDALSVKEEKEGWILACQARAVTGKLVLDA